MKIDPSKSKERYLNWKEKTSDGIPGISIENSRIIKQFLNDMELGINVANDSKKGARSYIRLNTLKDRMILLVRHIKNHLNLDNIIQIKEDELIGFFTDMRNGKITRQGGREYRSVVDYVKTFKTFWHWYMKVQKKQGEEVSQEQHNQRLLMYAFEGKEFSLQTRKEKKFYSKQHRYAG